MRSRALAFALASGDTAAAAKRSTRLVTGIVLAVPLGFVLVVWVAGLFDTMNWPVFHTWGMMHGAILLALPACIVVAFGLLGLLPWLDRNAPTK